jgi:serine/threonine-protein kinase
MISPPQSVEQLLRAAREFTPTDRHAFLDHACRDSPELRRLVEDRLLAEGHGSGSTGDRMGSDSETRTEPPPVGPRATHAARFCPGQVIAGRFAVIRYIDRGGMGEVYEVEDHLLQGVHVALKMILPEIADNEGSSRRFQQEVLLARKVTHPNLCPIYDIAASNDPPPRFLFLTMKLLTGETLSSRLRRAFPVPREEAIAIFRQMVAGLGALHAAGVIHRDIKPKNVMLEYSGTQLCLLIMDFGLACLHQPETTMETRTLVAGTPGYMAPEILAGPSQATDIFALGVLLHQVLSGDPPCFNADSSSFEPSSALNIADVPPAFIHCVKEFLANDPQRRCVAFDRMQSALGSGSSHADLATTPGIPPWIQRRSVRVTLWIPIVVLMLAGLMFVPAIGDRVRGVLLSSKEKHIAVLPLESAGGTPETQAIGDGLMDSLAGKLSNLDATNNSLWVVPASEVRSRKVTSPSAAFREFGATIVVEGSFERGQDGAQLRLTLVDTKKVREIGFVPLESKDGDLVALQDEAVTRLARLLNIPTKDDAEQAAEGSVPRAAEEDYLLALGYEQRFDRKGYLDLAIKALENAVNTDPHFALGFARLAQVYVLKYGVEKNPDWLAKAQQYSNQALQLDARVPLAHIALGEVEQRTGHHDLAVQEFQHAIDLDPKDPDALTGLAAAGRDLGRNAEAEAIFIRAANLRPDDWNGYNKLGLFLKRIGRPYDAIKQFHRALELAPDNSGVYANLGTAYLNTGDPKMTREQKQHSANPSRSIRTMTPMPTLPFSMGHSIGSPTRSSQSDRHST